LPASEGVGKYPNKPDTLISAVMEITLIIACSRSLPISTDPVLRFFRNLPDDIFFWAIAKAAATKWNNLFL